MKNYAPKEVKVFKKGPGDYFIKDGETKEVLDPTGSGTDTLKKGDIAESIDPTSTNAKVAGAKAVYDFLGSNSSVKEYASKSAFPTTGIENTLYVAKDTNSTYRYDVATAKYIAVGSSLELGIEATQAFYGNRGLQLENDRGVMSSLQTTNKSTLVGAINEVYNDELASIDGTGTGQGAGLEYKTNDGTTTTVNDADGTAISLARTKELGTLANIDTNIKKDNAVEAVNALNESAVHDLTDTEQTATVGTKTVSVGEEVKKKKFDATTKDFVETNVLNNYDVEGVSTPNYFVTTKQSGNVKDLNTTAKTLVGAINELSGSFDIRDIQATQQTQGVTLDKVKGDGTKVPVVDDDGNTVTFTEKSETGTISTLDSNIKEDNIVDTINNLNEAVMFDATDNDKTVDSTVVGSDLKRKYYDKATSTYKEEAILDKYDVGGVSTDNYVATTRQTGFITNLLTLDKTDLVTAINELYRKDIKATQFVDVLDGTKVVARKLQYQTYDDVWHDICTEDVQAFIQLAQAGKLTDLLEILKTTDTTGDITTLVSAINKAALLATISEDDITETKEIETGKSVAHEVGQKIQVFDSFDATGAVVLKDLTEVVQLSILGKRTDIHKDLLTLDATGKVTSTYVDSINAIYNKLFKAWKYEEFKDGDKVIGKQLQYQLVGDDSTTWHYLDDTDLQKIVTIAELGKLTDIQTNLKTVDATSGDTTTIVSAINKLYSKVVLGVTDYDATDTVGTVEYVIGANVKKKTLNESTGDEEESAILAQYTEGTETKDNYFVTTRQAGKVSNLNTANKTIVGAINEIEEDLISSVTAVDKEGSSYYVDEYNNSYKENTSRDIPSFVTGTASYCFKNGTTLVWTRVKTGATSLYKTFTIGPDTIPADNYVRVDDTSFTHSSKTYTKDASLDWVGANNEPWYGYKVDDTDVVWIKDSAPLSEGGTINYNFTETYADSFDVTEVDGDVIGAVIDVTRHDGTEVKDTKVLATVAVTGELSNLETTAKDNLVDAINEVKSTAGTAHYYGEDEPETPTEGMIWQSPDDASTVSYAAIIQAVYDAMHPVGEHLICFEVPVVPSGVTATWEVDTTYDGKALWVDSTQDMGTALAGSLPDIEGSIQGCGFTSSRDGSSPSAITGAFADSTYKSGYGVDSGDTNFRMTSIYFDAKDSNSVYSATAGANVVRPTSVTVKVYKRTA